MKHRILLGLLFLVSFGCLQITAQTDEAKPAFKLVSVGVINGKAVALPRPEFPATARAVGASGAVNVKVTIDEEGNVISATAISGHPLLKAVSVEAAKSAKFNPTLLSGQPVKIAGIIIYNFASGETLLSWRSVGYELAVAEQAEQLPLNFPAGPISMFLPASWNDERMEVGKLRAVQTSVKTSGAAKGQMVTATQTIDIASIDHKQVLGSLKSSLETRLASDQTQLWNFKLGLLLGKMSTVIDDETALRSSIQEIRQLAMNAPFDRAKLVNSLDEFSAKSTFSTEDRTRIKEIIESAKTN